MANEITTKAGAEIDQAALSRSRPDFLGFNRNGLTIEMGEATIFADRAPSETQRTRLLERAERLRAALEPSFSSAAIRTVLAMLAGLPAQNGEAMDLQLRGEAYRMAIDDLPAWAIEHQAKHVNRHGTKHGKTYAPSPAAFREAVSDNLAPLRKELNLIEAILGARVISDPPDLYRLPPPGSPTYADVMGEIESERSAGAWRTPYATGFLADLAARKAKTIPAEETGKQARAA